MRFSPVRSRHAGLGLPDLPEPYRSDQRFRAYERRNAKRIHVGDLLTARPDLAVAHSDRVLAVIACDEDVSFNRQLIYPVLNAVGQRTVQRYLISVIETGPKHRKVCAVRARYWSQITLDRRNRFTPAIVTHRTAYTSISRLRRS